MDCHAAEGFAGLDLCHEHVYLEALPSEQGGARLDVCTHSAVSHPTGCDEQRR